MGGFLLSAVQDACDKYFQVVILVLLIWSTVIIKSWPNKKNPEFMAHL